MGVDVTVTGEPNGPKEELVIPNQIFTIHWLQDNENTVRFTHSALNFRLICP